MPRTNPPVIGSASTEANTSVAFRTFQQNWQRLTEIIVADLEHIRHINEEAQKKGTDQMKAQMKAALRASRFNNLLQLVLVVTITETYLQDVLAECAAYHPRIMKGDQVNFPKVLAFDDVDDAGSIDEVKAEFFTRWSRGFIADGGPRRWIDRLTRLGGKTVVDLDIDLLEELWGVRHVVVHSAGVATRDFARRHTRLGLKAGERLEVPGSQFSTYTGVVLQFVGAVEDFLYKAFLIGAQTTGSASTTKKADTPGLTSKST